MSQKTQDMFRSALSRRELVKKGDHIVIGLSGGPDSVCLFHLFANLSQSWDLSLYPVHINHRLRPGDAERDRDYTVALAASLGFPCRVVERDCCAVASENSMSGEEAGRKIRYEAFSRVAEEIAGTGVPRERIKIAVGHNRNDQMETILFRFLRGTGPDGLAGMAMKRENEMGFQVIRPLLEIDREDIAGYCSANGLSPCLDKTNALPVYVRNKIRLELLPLLSREYNAGIGDALLRLGNIAAQDRDYLEDKTKRALEDLLQSGGEDRCRLDGAGLRELHPAIRRRVLLEALERIGLAMDMEYVHLEQLESLIAAGRTSSRTDLPGGYACEISYGAVDLYRKGDGTGGPPIPPELKVRIYNREDYIPAKGKAAFDLDLFLEEYRYLVDPVSMIAVRTREPGDFIVLPGVGGRKRIQDFLVDLKIPRELRDGIFIVALGNEILWIPEGAAGSRHSGSFRIHDGTKKVLTLEITGGL